MGSIRVCGVTSRKGGSCDFSIHFWGNRVDFAMACTAGSLRVMRKEEKALMGIFALLDSVSLALHWLGLLPLVAPSWRGSGQGSPVLSCSRVDCRLRATDICAVFCCL